MTVSILVNKLENSFVAHLLEPVMKRCFTTSWGSNIGEVISCRYQTAQYDRQALIDKFSKKLSPIVSCISFLIAGVHCNTYSLVFIIKRHCVYIFTILCSRPNTQNKNSTFTSNFTDTHSSNIITITNGAALSIEF